LHHHLVSLVQAAHEVAVEESAGQGSGLADEEFAHAGARIVPTHAEAFDADRPALIDVPVGGMPSPKMFGRSSRIHVRERG